MVALAVLGIAIISIFQLFSAALRTTKKADDYTRAIFYARSMLDNAYSVHDVSEYSDSQDFEDGFSGSLDTQMVYSSEDEKVKLFEILVTISWPPKGMFRLKGLRTVYETE
jgi:type II secretory pathway pseudopilin PulG